MAPETRDALGSWTEQFTGSTQEAVTSYFNWLQNTMSASPWANSDLNKKLLSYATESVTAASGLMQQLSGAKNLEDAIKIQTEFVKTQIDTFNQRAKELGEIYTKIATTATKTPSGLST
jgi:hypothetical protein